MDKILLRGVVLDVHLGVSWGERMVLQQVVVDVDVTFDTRRAAATDHFGDTIDYSGVHATVRRAATASPHALVETMADRVAAAVLAEFPVTSVRVLLRKPGALRDRNVDWAGVEILRERNG